MHIRVGIKTSSSCDKAYAEVRREREASCRGVASLGLCRESSRVAAHCRPVGLSLIACDRRVARRSDQTGGCTVRLGRTWYSLIARNRRVGCQSNQSGGVARNCRVDRIINELEESCCQTEHQARVAVPVASDRRTPRKSRRRTRRLPCYIPTSLHVGCGHGDLPLFPPARRHLTGLPTCKCHQPVSHQPRDRQSRGCQSRGRQPVPDVNFVPPSPDVISSHRFLGQLNRVENRRIERSEAQDRSRYLSLHIRSFVCERCDTEQVCHNWILIARVSPISQSNG